MEDPDDVFVEERVTVASVVLDGVAVSSGESVSDAVRDPVREVDLDCDILDD